jgi:hypothetical protein
MCVPSAGWTDKIFLLIYLTTDSKHSIMETTEEGRVRAVRAKNIIQLKID